MKTFGLPFILWQCQLASELSTGNTFCWIYQENYVIFAQVTSEGGFDAAMEAPYIYAAIDALAVRAGKWAERRQRCLLEASQDNPALLSAEAAAAAAITAVKEVMSRMIPTLY